MNQEKHLILVIDDEIGIPDSPERTAFLRAVGYFPSTGGKEPVKNYPYEFEFHSGRNEAVANSVEAVKNTVLAGWPFEDKRRWSLVLLDVRFGADAGFGFTLLRALRDDPRFDSDLPIVMLTSEGSGKNERADKLRANGFFPKADEDGKPVWSEKGLHQRVLRFGLIPDDRDAALLDATKTVRLLGRSLPMLKMLREARRCGLDIGNRILYGETGSGKTELAGYIHCFTGREGPYRHWIADAPNPQLMKTKLFGWWKNAFSDAKISEPGEIEKAHGGTFFLDEISNLPPEIQTTFLGVRKQDEQGRRIIEREGKFPLGTDDQRQARQSVVEGAELLSDFRIRTDVYLISGTKDNLEDPLVREKKGFRDDLHNALGSPLRCLSLNERSEDIPELFTAFVRAELNRPGSPQREFVIEQDVFDLLGGRNWSQRGNIRDLERIAQYAAQQLGDFRTIHPDRLPPDVLNDAKSTYLKAAAAVEKAEATPAPIPTGPEAVASQPSIEKVSSAAGSLAQAELQHLRLRAGLLEDAAEATRKEDPSTGIKGKYQPTAAVARLMGNKVTPTNAKRIIKDILGAILDTPLYMVEAYGEKQLSDVRAWISSRPVLMSFYRYAKGDIEADKI